MKVESWQGINGKLVHDEQKAIVVDNDQVLTDQKQLDQEISQNEQAFNELASQLVPAQVNDQSKPEAHNEG